MDYLRRLFAPVARDADDVEVRSLIAFALWIGNRFMAPDHGDRTRADVLQLTLEALVSAAFPGGRGGSAA